MNRANTRSQLLVCAGSGGALCVRRQPSLKTDRASTTSPKDLCIWYASYLNETVFDSLCMTMPPTSCAMISAAMVQCSALATRV